MPDVQYTYIQKFSKRFLVFENPFIILKRIIFLFSSTPLLFIRAVLKLLLVKNINDFKWGFGYSFEMFWGIELNAGEITTINTNKDTMQFK